MPDGNTTIIIQGKKHFELDTFATRETLQYFKATIKYIDDIKPDKKDKEFKATVDAVKDMALQIIKLNPQIPAEAAFAIKNIESPAFLVHFF